jgi:proline iminopeptidase
MSLVPGYEPYLSVRELSWQMVFARLVTHYWGHGCFLSDNEVLANMARIADIPATLVHGTSGGPRRCAVKCQHVP